MKVVYPRPSWNPLIFLLVLLCVYMEFGLLPQCDDGSLSLSYELVCNVSIFVPVLYVEVGRQGFTYSFCVSEAGGREDLRSTTSVPPWTMTKH